MIVAVLECPMDDSAQLFFVDLEKLDKNDLVQKHYYDNIVKAMSDDMKCETTSFDASVSYGHEILHPATVNPPCHVDEDVTLYIE